MKRMAKLEEIKLIGKEEMEAIDRIVRRSIQALDEKEGVDRSELEELWEVAKRKRGLVR